jgi:IS1 family transposase
MANVLPRTKQIAVLGALVEGVSVRSTERMTGVHRDTILRLMIRVGNGCADLLDETMRDLTCSRLELDELWSFIAKKQRRVQAEDDPSYGDVWTYIAIDPETKLIPSFLVGKRDVANTNAFVADLASRLRYRVQLSSDAMPAYRNAIASAFKGNVDYAALVKEYEAEPAGAGRYSPPRVTSIEKIPVFGEPIAELVCTSYVENKNLHLRMGVRRYTRLVNAHSKKWENHAAMTALHFAHYNLVKMHSTIRCTPAMAAGVASTVWSMDELVDAALECEERP